MKHFMTSLALVGAVTGNSQVTNCFPYNHDSNIDGHIGTEDLMSLLSHCGSPWELNVDVGIRDCEFQALGEIILWSLDDAGWPFNPLIVHGTMDAAFTLFEYVPYWHYAEERVASLKI
jgi:hypothetical protein